MKLKYIAMEKNTVLKRQRDIRLVASRSEQVERLPIAKIVFWDERGQMFIEQLENICTKGIVPVLLYE